MAQFSEMGGKFETTAHTLREHLVVENKVVGILQQRQLGQDLPAEGTVPGVILGELNAQENVLECRKEAVGDVFIKRHAAEQSATADDARAEDDIVDVVRHHAGHRSDQQWGVLIVRVQHDDNISASSEGLAITGLLIAP